MISIVDIFHWMQLGEEVVTLLVLRRLPVRIEQNYMSNYIVINRSSSLFSMRRIKTTIHSYKQPPEI